MERGLLPLHFHPRDLIYILGLDRYIADASSNTVSPCVLRARSCGPVYEEGKNGMGRVEMYLMNGQVLTLHQIKRCNLLQCKIIHLWDCFSIS